MFLKMDVYKIFLSFKNNKQILRKRFYDKRKRLYSKNVQKNVNQCN